ncbi:sodium/calcium exchanger NCL2-like [Pyrus x bretschneideri]|uniref:sodium/calcium exchanger NCL2-like n=1 Tax=Pyrus x bretschneideri TaxID=225117 RepID=UPI002030211D|nr:sodium/calcium exchanger NCL2-like [Pyrus x bretschneideri]
MSRPALFIIFLVLQLVHLGSGRIVRDSGLVSNGTNDEISQSSILDSLNLKEDSVTCEPIFGFLPCATSVWGLLFLVIVYEVLLSLADQYVSRGSEIFFELFGTGVFGASAFHLLGLIPQVGMVLVIGVTATTETVEEMAEMSMSMLAGSSIMILTLIWGSVVAFGSSDLSDSQTLSNPENKKPFSLTGLLDVAFGSSDLSDSQTSSNPENKKPFSLTGSGVRTDVETRDTARIMMFSLIPYLILQLAKILTSTTAVRVVILISLLIASAFLATYFIYQFFQPWIQSRRLEYLLRKYIPKNILPSLMTVGGKPNVSIIKGLFHKIDKNHNKNISSDELRALILGIQIEEIGLDDDDYAAEVMKQFDLSGDAQIAEMEFVNGISKWINPAKPPANDKGHEHRSLFRRNNSKNEKSMEDQLTPLISKKNVTKGADTSWMNLLKAAFLIILGTGITVFLSMPLMVSLREFSTAASIPSFAASYVVIPLATNYRLVLMSVTSAKEKTEDAISLTLSEIYTAAFMNNIVGLVIFLALVYIRNLSWDVAAEVLVVLLISTAVGFSASFSRKFPFWTSVLAYILYPISLLLVYVLTTVIGWY